MQTMLAIWVLNTYAKDRGYNLTDDELKEFVPYSNEAMKKKLKLWQKGRKQVEG